MQRTIIRLFDCIPTILSCRLFVPSAFWNIPLQTQRKLRRVKLSFHRSRSTGNLVSVPSSLLNKWNFTLPQAHHHHHHHHHQAGRSFCLRNICGITTSWCVL